MSTIWDPKDILLSAIEIAATFQRLRADRFTPFNGQHKAINCDLSVLYDVLANEAKRRSCLPRVFDFINVISPAKFLDVGCGGGTTLLLAYALGFEVRGLENDPLVINMAEQIVDSRWIVNMDAMDYPFYNNADVIFMYAPFADQKRQQKLEEKVIDEMKPGATLIPQHLITIKEPYTKEAGGGATA